MRGKQGKSGNIVMGLTGILILLGALLFLLKEAIGGFGVIILSVAALGGLSFLGWFVLDMMH